MSLDLPVVYQWKSVVKFGGITTGKTVDFSDKPLVIPVISIVISVDHSGNTTKFYHWKPLVIPPDFTADFHW